MVRNPEWLIGKSNDAFAVALVFGDFKRTYPQTSFEEACNVAGRMSNDYRVNYIIEEGIDPEYDEWAKS